MIEVRTAREDDVAAIGHVFRATYGDAYCYPQFYDLDQLKKLVFTDDAELLVAEDTESGQILGTASVILHIGAYADLVGEFGRLAVHPDARGRGIASRLMDARIERVRDRLHVGIVENRVAHPYSQKVSLAHGFVPVGFLPLKLQLGTRESVVVYARFFGDALRFRKNHPRLIPEIYPLADLALSNCGVEHHVIVDEDVAPYPFADDYELEEMNADGYATLLRFQRGRVKRREIFGPLRLHYGLFKLRATHSHYLIARRNSQLVAAIGYTHDEVERTARIFELISTSDEPVRFLLREALRTFRDNLDVDYVETDVNADASRMQRTLLELGFLPAAYLPALVFHDVERLDTVKMVKLLGSPELGTPTLADPSKPIADWVLSQFVHRRIAPEIRSATAHAGIFSGLSPEQADTLARAFTLRNHEQGETIFRAGEESTSMSLVLSGNIAIHIGNEPQRVGDVRTGECVGEWSLLNRAPHAADAIAETDVAVASAAHDDLFAIVRRRPDIGVVIYRNLATGIGEKLRRSDQRL